MREYSVRIGQSKRECLFLKEREGERERQFVFLRDQEQKRNGVYVALLWKDLRTDIWRLQGGLYSFQW